jgi:hypothetical protein
VLRFVVTANFVPSSPIPVTLMMEAILSSKTSVLTTAKLRNIAEDDILHSQRRKILKSFNRDYSFKGGNGLLPSDFTFTAHYHPVIPGPM